MIKLTEMVSRQVVTVNQLSISTDDILRLLNQHSAGCLAIPLNAEIIARRGDNPGFIIRWDKTLPDSTSTTQHTELELHTDGSIGLPEEAEKGPEDRVMVEIPIAEKTEPQTVKADDLPYDEGHGG